MVQRNLAAETWTAAFDLHRGTSYERAYAKRAIEHPSLEKRRLRTPAYPPRLARSVTRRLRQHEGPDRQQTLRRHIEVAARCWANVSRTENAQCAAREAGEQLTDESPPWSSRSVLVSVSDLDRSAAFYQAVLEIHEVVRDEQIAILRGDASRPFTVYLRQALRGASRSGQDSLGVRSLGFDVGSKTALDRVEERLRAIDAFRDRQSVPSHDKLEVIRGHDPDRFPLSFVADESGTGMSEADNAYVIALMYAIDV